VLQRRGVGLLLRQRVAADHDAQQVGEAEVLHDRHGEPLGLVRDHGEAVAAPVQLCKVLAHAGEQTHVFRALVDVVGEVERECRVDGAFARGRFPRAARRPARAAAACGAPVADESAHRGHRQAAAGCGGRARGSRSRAMSASVSAIVPSRSNRNGAGELTRVPYTPGAP
jgi:hypothetical protein